MIEMLMSVVLAFGISFYALPAIIHVTIKKGLFDFPDERKVHHNPVPSLGGLAVYAGFITAFLLSVAFSGERYVMQYFVAASLVMFFIGLKDDLLNISAFKKFLCQILAASLLVFKGGLLISSMGGIFGIYDLQPVAGQLFTIFTIVVIINAYNLIDGIDGLAGSLSFISCLALAVYFSINGDWVYACMATSYLGAVAAFLIFNFPPARIFMGDTGSLLAGLVNATLTVHFIQTAGSAAILPMAAPAGMGFSLLFVPLFDTFRVFSFRILKGIPPFTPDRNHIHHILLRFGWSHLKITGVLSAFSFIFLGLGYLLQPMGNTMLLIVMHIFGFGLVTYALLAYRRHRKKLLQDSIPRISVARSKKVSVVSVVPHRAAK